MIGISAFRITWPVGILCTTTRHRVVSEESGKAFLIGKCCLNQCLEYSVEFSLERAVNILMCVFTSETPFGVAVC